MERSTDIPAGDTGGERVVVDDPSRQRFVYSEDGAEAHLVYRLDGDRLTLVHTEVPAAIGGRGVGGLLVRAAVGRAAKNRETVVPSCSYARKWLEGHPDVAGDVVIDWGR